jgi:hypothetical protein
MHKLGVIVPYRNRPTQLSIFCNSIKEYLKAKNIEHELIIVEQSEKNDFNRGKLLNVGFIKAEELGCDYVVFHDVDMLPIDADYSYSAKPTHLITDLDLPEGVSRTLFDEYFGGVTLFPVNSFKQINGYTNKFYGWGFEDDDLLLRCLENHIELDGVEVLQRGREGVTIDFNGQDSMVAIPNRLSSSRNFSIFVSFGYDKIGTSKEVITDNNSIFSIPGFDTTLTVNSFFDLTFQFWKKDLSSIALHTKGLQTGRFNAVITGDVKGANNNTTNYIPPIIKFYVNGIKVGENTFDKLSNIQNSSYIYLGVGNPEREEKRNWFNGNIDTFALYNSTLTDDEILELSSNLTHSLFTLSSADKLVSYYDGKFINGNELIDLKGGQNGRVFNCTQSITQLTTNITKPIPFRREGKFKVLPHQENGYKDGYWVSWTSRKNQLKYLDNYYSLKSDYQNDGLTTCKFVVLEEEYRGYYHYKVRI